MREIEMEREIKAVLQDTTLVNVETRGVPVADLRLDAWIRKDQRKLHDWIWGPQNEQSRSMIQGAQKLLPLCCGGCALTQSSCCGGYSIVCVSGSNTRSDEFNKQNMVPGLLQPQPCVFSCILATWFLCGIISAGVALVSVWYFSFQPILCAQLELRNYALHLNGTADIGILSLSNMSDDSAILEGATNALKRCMLPGVSSAATTREWSQDAQSVSFTPILACGLSVLASLVMMAILEAGGCIASETPLFSWNANL